MWSHSPRGGCGLKSLWKYQSHSGASSLSARRVWIEIGIFTAHNVCSFCHSPRGGCGLKYCDLSRLLQRICHSPRGGCGLKFFGRANPCGKLASLSARRVWIEICMSLPVWNPLSCHSPRGGCGLKWFLPGSESCHRFPSLSARRVWIEIGTQPPVRCRWEVTLREEGVD